MSLLRLLSYLHITKDMIRLSCFFTIFLLLYHSLCFGQSEGNSSNSSSSSGSSVSGAGVAVGSNYILQPSDVIEVEVYQEDDLYKMVRIEGDGTVALALIGKVEVAGLTVSEAKSLITNLYNRDYLVDPQVSVLVRSFSPKVIRVLGSVNRPGVVEMPPDRDLTLTEAIAEAGGISRLGNPKSLKIKRVSNENGDSQQIDVNFSRIITDPDTEDIILEEGDTIWVPERVI